MERKLFSNSFLFQLYGIVNVILIAFLLTLLVLIFNEIYLLTRIQFVAFIGIHIFLLFFVRNHYLSVFYDEKQQKIEFHYNKKFGLKWTEKSRTVLLPVNQFDGYEISSDALGLPVISFFKKEKNERFELGPFHVGYISKKELQQIKELKTHFQK